MKVTVVGSGNVGATVANVLATKGFASEVVLIDIKEGLSEGKAMDIMQTLCGDGRLASRCCHQRHSAQTRHDP